MKELKLKSSAIDSLICLDGDFPAKEVFEMLAGAKLMAADGAAREIFKMGLFPDTIIGDMDSLDDKFIPSHFDKTRIHRIGDQETNDFEKNLIFAIECGYKNILVTGFHGGDLEHTLNNWSVFMKFAERLNLCILDKKRFAVPINESVHFRLKPDEIISLIPQTKAKITTSGFRWELNNEELALGVREGAHNRALANKVEIVLHSGSLILFFDERLPLFPVIE
jgi:thiamine pyrophosphokinase